MPARNLLALFAVPISLVPLLAAGQQSTFPATPLASKKFPSPTSLPYQVDQDPELIRGRQSGYNICNSTTENQSSRCQTSFVNALDNFCLWAPMQPNSVVAATEGEMVAWCTKPGHGTRLIPNGALKGVQYVKTPAYAQVVGFIDQRFINIKSDDYGGEMDPHGADLRGNPLGGIMYSTAFNGRPQQAIEWHNFMGNNIFCIKVCDPSGPDAARYCNHIFDRIGCAYNAPNTARNGTFESCDGDNQDFPGVYTATGGQIMTYTQPDEALGPITSMPYTAKIPASSNCRQFSSTSVFAALATVSNSAVSVQAAPTQTSSRPAGSSSGSRTSTATGAPPSTGGASILMIPSISMFASLALALLS